MGPYNLFHNIRVLSDKFSTYDKYTAGVICFHLSRLHYSTPVTFPFSNRWGWMRQEDSINPFARNSGGGVSWGHSENTHICLNIKPVLTEQVRERGSLNRSWRESSYRNAY